METSSRSRPAGTPRAPLSSRTTAMVSSVTGSRISSDDQQRRSAAAADGRFAVRCADPPVHRVEHHRQHRGPQQHVEERLEHQPADVERSGEHDSERDESGHVNGPWRKSYPQHVRQLNTIPLCQLRRRRPSLPRQHPERDTARPPIWPTSAPLGCRDSRQLLPGKIRGFSRATWMIDMNSCRKRPGALARPLPKKRWSAGSLRLQRASRSSDHRRATTVLCMGCHR